MTTNCNGESWMGSWKTEGMTGKNEEHLNKVWPLIIMYQYCDKCYK